MISVGSISISIKRANIQLQCVLKNRFLVPPVEHKLAPLAVSDSYISVQWFLPDASMAPDKSGDILETKPVPDQEYFDYGLLFS